MEDELREVLDATPEQFMTWVNADVRGVADEHIGQMLRSEQCAERWLNALHAFKRNSEAQLTADRAERTEKHYEIFVTRYDNERDSHHRIVNSTKLSVRRRSPSGSVCAATPTARPCGGARTAGR